MLTLVLLIASAGSLNCMEQALKTRALQKRARTMVELREFQKKITKKIDLLMQLRKQQQRAVSLDLDPSDLHPCDLSKVTEILAEGLKTDKLLGLSFVVISAYTLCVFSLLKILQGAIAD